LYPFGQLNDTGLLQAYTAIMDRYRVPDALNNMMSLVRHSDPIVRLHALQYFAGFPRAEVAGALIEFAEEGGWWRNDLYVVVSAFIGSPAISAEDRAKLSALLASGKVQKDIIER